jgi:hypothetical protein
MFVFFFKKNIEKNGHKITCCLTHSRFCGYEWDININDKWSDLADGLYYERYHKLLTIFKLEYFHGKDVAAMKKDARIWARIWHTL